MVAGAGADHHERHVVLGGDLGDERLGAVAAGHAEQVAPRGHGRAGELLHVGARPVEQRDLGAERLGPLLQAEPGHLAAARSRVHHQERPHRCRGVDDRQRPLRTVAGAGRSVPPAPRPRAAPRPRQRPRAAGSAAKITSTATGAPTARASATQRKAPRLPQEPEAGGHHDEDGRRGQQHQPHRAPLAEDQQHERRENREGERRPGLPSPGTQRVHADTSSAPSPSAEAMLAGGVAPGITPRGRAGRVRPGDEGNGAVPSARGAAVARRSAAADLAGLAHGRRAAAAGPRRPAAARCRHQPRRLRRPGHALGGARTAAGG